METPSYLSELFRIVEGAIRLDGVKVRNYADLLAAKLQGSGDMASAQRLRKIINEQAVQLHPKRIAQETPPPVDGESRFPLIQELRIPETVDTYVFTKGQREFVDDYLSVVRSKAALERKGIEAGTNLLLYGPPGCGKTLLACYIARQIHLPLYVARLDGLISSFLGSTAKNIRAVFEFAARTPCVLLLDEFDAIAKLRDDQQELGELKRVVNSFVQNMDALGRETILIAATNHERLLDPAVWRRFQYLLHIGLPDTEQRLRLWESFSRDLGWSTKDLRILADLSEGFSIGAIENACVKLRQRIVTRSEQANLQGALSALLSSPHDEAGVSRIVTAAQLQDVGKVARFLRTRNPALYSLSTIAEIVGVSKATMSRKSRVRRMRGQKP